MNETLHEGIYLLKTREFANSNQEIYKIGRSHNLSQRVLNYPNKSVIHLMIECTDSPKHEKYLINLFCKKYKQECDYGREYFFGALNDMKDDIIDYIKSIMNMRIYKMINDTIIIDRKTLVGNKTLYRHQMDLIKCIVHNPTKNINKINKQNILNFTIKKLDEPKLLEFKQTDKIQNNINLEESTKLEFDINQIDSKSIKNNNLSDINLVCLCGYKSKNIKQLDKHKAKCNEINKECIDESFIKKSRCIHCKKIFARKFSCERHMLICKSKKPDNNNLEKIFKNKLYEAEKKLILIKNFVNLFEFSNDIEKELLLNNNNYKTEIDFLMK